MSTFMIVVLAVAGVLALVIGGLVWVFFHQGGCCIRRAVQKINRKSYVAPVLKQE